jgi:Bacteriophage HK97-gp10, putative tail-component
MRMEVHGLAELAAGVRKLAGNIEQAVPPAFERVADHAAGTVQGRLPRRTGRLAATVHADQTSDGATLSMGEGVRYAQFVEYGGRGHPHSSQGNYLYPAAQAAEPLLVQAGERVVTNEIGAMTWPSPG